MRNQFEALSLHTLSRRSLKDILRKAPPFLKRKVLPAFLSVGNTQRKYIGKWPCLENPTTFSEKIAARKLFDRDPRLPNLVDKYEVKRIMAERYGSDFVVPLLHVAERPEEIPFDQLKPPYIVKDTLGTQRNVVINNTDFDRDAVVRELEKSRDYNLSVINYEWAYGVHKSRFIVEPIVKGLADYKFHVFDENVFAVEVEMTDKATGLDHTTFFTESWNALPFRYSDTIPSPVPISKPRNLASLWRRAAEIGTGFSYVRVDLYSVEGKTSDEDRMLFGEMTFYPYGGDAAFSPPAWDHTFGVQWTPNWKAPRWVIPCNKGMRHLMNGLQSVSKRSKKRKGATPSGPV